MFLVYYAIGQLREALFPEEGTVETLIKECQMFNSHSEISH
jgi:hypothetical protein